MTNDWVKNWQDGVEEMKPVETGSEFIHMHDSPRVIRDFFTSEDLRGIGIKCGNGCLVHERALIYGRDKITLGDNVRIDAFCVLSSGDGFINIGSYTHVSSYCMFIGSHGINIKDFSAVGAGSKIFSVSDEFVGSGLIGPMVPSWSRVLKNGLVTLEKYSALGVNCTVMPGATLSEGSFMYANSLLLGVSEPYAILSGQPAKKIKERSRSFVAHLARLGVPYDPHL